MSWSSRFPAYQLDFTAAASGKRVASTKRRIRWRFGFPNKQALDDGRTGIDCRGEEHDIVIVWSITSGKRQVMMDGQEVHFSVSRSGVLEHSWPGRGNHVMKVIAHAAPPLSATPGFRQYDFLIDGQSFFNLPKVYELGLRRPNPAYERNPGAPPQGVYDHPPANMNSRNDYEAHRSPPTIARAPRTRSEEEAELKRAIQASLEESRKYLESKHNNSDDHSFSSAPLEITEDLLGPADNAPAPRGSDAHSMISYSSMPPPHYPNQSQPAYQFSAQPPPPAVQNAYSMPPQAGQAYGNQPTPAYPAPAPHSYSASAGYATYAAPASQNAQVLQLTNGPGSGSGPPPQYQTPPVQPPAPSYGAPPQGQPAAFANQQLGAQYGYPAPAPGTGATLDAFAPQVASTDVFNLHQQPVDDPFAPKPPPPPTHNDIANVILGAYGNAPVGAPSNPLPGGQPGAENPSGQQLALQDGGAQINGSGNKLKLSMNDGLTMNGYVETAEEEEPMNDFDKALKKLVNIDRIDEPVDKVLTLDQKKKLQEEEMRRNKGKSKPLPPAAHGMVGAQASLQQISTVKPAKPVKNPEEIMRPPQYAHHPNAAMAGALVVHGQGPPPLEPRGFGIVHRPGAYR